jgi:PhzF family phenazine biosynthesis protein
MTIDIYQIDAFTTQLFQGNPAAVCPLKEWLPFDMLLNIAKENNLAETAYFVHKHDNVFHLRWFTPEIEMDLCGHATLASAYVISECMDYEFDTIVFETLSGDLIVKKTGDQLEMSFPLRPPEFTTLPEIIKNSLNMYPKEVLKARDYLLVYNSEKDILRLKVNAAILDKINLDPRGIIVTAKGNNSDFVSRFFTPGAAVFEDSVTGSAHCTLVPFWAERLNKTTLHARQVSQRGGDLYCKLENKRVFIKGSAIKYLQGQIDI